MPIFLEFKAMTHRLIVLAYNFISKIIDDDLAKNSHIFWYLSK